METKPILVVDDEPDMRTALTQVLNCSGHAVSAASTGQEALEKFREEQFKLVITDVKMPEMSGMEFLQKVKKLSPQIPVIMITGYGTIANAVEAMKEGASDYLIKPFSFEHLEAVVKKVCLETTGPGTKKVHEVATRKKSGGKKIVTQDAHLLKILDLAEDVAASNATVLIQGESGTGKELLACFIHHHSDRSEQAYVTMNCAALPEGLAESELFGHEKGSFTGATGRKTGKFELANYGTILLDEITEMSAPLQAKLLRVIQEREIDRIGGAKPIPIDVRIIAISNRDVKKAVKEGTFREDLFYRLNVIPITIPSLRERKGDVPVLADYFLEKYTRGNKSTMKKIAEETVALLLKYDWKGNIRELENTIQRAVLLGKGEVLLPKHLFLEEPSEGQLNANLIRVGISLREMEKELIVRTLEEVDDNRTKAAKILGISIRTLRNKLREYREEGEARTKKGALGREHSAGSPLPEKMIRCA